MHVSEYPAELEDFRNWLSSESQIQLLQAKTGEETEALLNILIGNLGFIIAMVAAKAENPEVAAGLITEALTNGLFDVAAGWLPMAVACERRDNKGFLAAFERKALRPGEIPPAG